MKTALITGSTKGIGKQIGIDLIDNGYYVYFNGSTSQSTTALENELLGCSDINIICQDLSTLDGNLELANYLKAQDEYVDVLILNLGITNRAVFGAVCYDEWKKVIDVNVSFPFFLVQSLVSHIRENGKIIFISSISGIVPDAISISYGVSKAAVNMLAIYLAKELANRKITVNAIAPGYIDTTWHSKKPQDQIERITNKCLQKRLGTTQEVSKAVFSLINNDFITGQIIRVDGGFGLI